MASYDMKVRTSSSKSVIIRPDMIENRVVINAEAECNSSSVCSNFWPGGK